MFTFDYYQLLLTITLVIVTILLSFIIGFREKRDILIISALAVWHTLFCIFYYIFSFFNTVDSTAYYEKTLLGHYEFYPGSRFVVFVSGLFYTLFDAGYLNSFLFFNIFGVLGLIILYKVLKPYLLFLRSFWFLILFIPSMSFWSSALGKDSIVFFGVCLFLYSVVNNKLKILLPLAFFFIFMIRPHVALIIIISYFLYIVIVSRVNLFIKIITVFIVLLSLYSALGFIKEYIGLDDVSLTGVSDYVDNRQSLNQAGGSSFDLSSMSYPLQMFTYVFRPLPFDAYSGLTLLTSIENTILLVIFSYTLYKAKIKNFFEGRNFWLVIYAFLVCSILALTTANLGIATRQKWMFMPIFIYLIVYSFYQFKYLKHKDKI